MLEEKRRSLEEDLSSFSKRRAAAQLLQAQSLNTNGKKDKDRKKYDALPETSTNQTPPLGMRDHGDLNLFLFSLSTPPALGSCERLSRAIQRDEATPNDQWHSTLSPSSDLIGQFPTLIRKMPNARKQTLDQSYVCFMVSNSFFFVLFLWSLYLSSVLF